MSLSKDKERVIGMITKVTGGYTRRDEITMNKAMLIIDTVIENGAVGIKMATTVSVVSHEKTLMVQAFEKMIPLEDFKHIDIPYAISEDGIIFEYNNHYVKYSETDDCLIIEEKDTRIDLVISLISLSIKDME